MRDDFNFYLEADISKSNGGEGRRLIRGYASTESEDRQDELLVQKGLDFSDFVKYGYFNYDHDNSIILGYPLPTCRVDNKGFLVNGELLKGIPMADRIWELALALKKSNAPRRIGFSVEGKVLAREGKRVSKAKIYNVAITTNPINTDCSWEAVVKSFSGQAVLGVDTLEKALEAGYETNPTEMEGGEVFRKEELDKDLHNLSYVIDNKENEKFLKQKLAGKKTLTKGETILYLQICKGWSRFEANKFIDKHLIN